MKKTSLVLILGLVVALPVRADFNDGVVAYLMGQYEKALELFEKAKLCCRRGFPSVASAAPPPLSCFCRACVRS